MKNGASSNGNAAPGGIRRRSGPRETVNLCAKFRDHFDTFVEAGYRTRGLEGAAGAAARRDLAGELAKARALLDDVIALLAFEAADMDRRALGR